MSDSVDQHVAAIAAVHPDWRELADDQAFHDFINKQPGHAASAMRRVVECGDADEVIDLINGFKARTGR